MYHVTVNCSAHSPYITTTYFNALFADGGGTFLSTHWHLSTELQ